MALVSGQDVEFKRFNITEEDWLNREQWDDYNSAVCDMVERTSTETAPWTLVEANDKLSAMVKVMSILCDRLERELFGNIGKQSAAESTGKAAGKQPPRRS